jgi:predicted Zn finger-like uncharacterized protein
MPIKAVCPECQTAYQLADHQAGKNVRCKNCEAVFEVDVSSRRTAIRGDDGSPSAGRAKPTMMARRRDPDEEDERDQPRRGSARSVEKKNALVWVLGGAAVGFGVLLLGCGALIAYLLMRDTPSEVVSASAPPQPAPAVARQPQQPPANAPNVPPPWQPDSQPVQGQPVEPAKPTPTATPTPTKPAEPPPQARSEVERPSEEKASSNGRLTAAGRDRVKRATVYLRVKMADGTQATGTGFFGCKEARNIILTNAHVVGMLSPESARPVAVEVFVNSGEANEWKTNARVLGVDRASDLAVLDIGTPQQTVPEPLTVKPAGGLNALDEVYVFGFPLGEQLGKEITIRPASVSALRKNQKTGVLDRVQVNGGMDPGNSGGPVVDNSGAVVGVAVSIIPGRQINFAIPGERVHAILDGRISDLNIHQPYFTSENKVAVPVAMDMIDPRNLIKEVGLEVWVGDKPANAKSGGRPSGTTQPAAQTGDSPHVYYKLKYNAPEGRAEILLPDLPPGKVYWTQPKWINAKGQTHWASGNPMTLPSEPVYRKPANLVLRHTQGAKRALDLTIENVFKIGNDDADDAFRVRTTTKLIETVTSAGSNGSLLSLRYKFAPSRDLVLPNGRNLPDSKLEPIKNDFPRLINSVIQLDRLGNITHQSTDNRSLRQLAQANRQQAEAMMGFHEMIQQGLEALSVSLPSEGTANPMKGWQAERQLPIDTPGKTETGKLDVTFTYQGVRKRDGRDEAVISMDGLVRGKDNSVGGKAHGRFLVDLSNGQTILAETTVKLQLKAILSSPDEQPRELRVIAIMNFRMQRKREL